MAVTQNDLNNLETKIKLDISKEQTDLRHWDRSKMQSYFNIVDDLKTDSALSKQSLTNMNNSIEKLEEVVKEWFKEIKDELKLMHNVFATKEEHQANKIEITEIKATHSKVITWVIGTVGTILLAFLWLIIKTLWIK